MKPTKIKNANGNQPQCDCTTKVSGIEYTTDVIPSDNFNDYVPDNEETPKEIIVGVLSKDTNFNLRQNLRETWIKLIPDNVAVYFLVDRPSDEIALENNTYGDMIVLYSNYKGNCNHFGEKMYKWLMIASDRFPQAKVVGKMDDDVYLCPKKVFSRIPLAGNTYYGSAHGKAGQPISVIRRHDEMFVFVGQDLIQEIKKRRYCPDKMSLCPPNSLKDTHYGGTSLGLWLQPYTNQVNMVDDKKLLNGVENKLGHYRCDDMMGAKHYLWNGIKQANDFKLVHQQILNPVDPSQDLEAFNLKVPLKTAMSKPCS